MNYIGGGRRLGVGEKPKAGNTIHKETNSSAVSSVGHRNCHSRSTWQAQTVVSSSLTPQAALLVPISGPIDPVVADRRGFAGSRGKRPPVKADLAIYSLVVGMSGLWVNVATMLNCDNKLDFYCCDNSVGFCKSSHIAILTPFRKSWIRPCILYIYM